jgi:hypothetical protein
MEWSGGVETWKYDKPARTLMKPKRGKATRIYFRRSRRHSGVRDLRKSATQARQVYVAVGHTVTRIAIIRHFTTLIHTPSLSRSYLPALANRLQTDVASGSPSLVPSAISDRGKISTNP